MRRVRWLAALAGSAVLTVGLMAGCGNGAAGDGEGGTIALSVSTLANPYFVDLRDATQAAADEAGYELVVGDAQDDASQQQNDIQNYVTQQVDAILVNPVDEEAVVPAVEEANNSDIPVIAVDRQPAGGELATTISSDNILGGQLAGEELIETVGSGPVVQLEGIPGTAEARDRGEGFQEEIDAQDEVELAASQPADFERGAGLNVMENLLQANPNIEGVFAQNDEMALGAVQALEERAGSEIAVIGFDATNDGLEAIQEGTMNATVAQNPGEIGRRGVENAVSTIEGEEVEEEIPVQVELVTEENIDEFTE